MPPGFHLIIAAQFASALADNALLIVTIALLHDQGLPVWWAPMLKFVFTISYVVLAPFVGPLADAFPKARLMAWMNGVKMLGVAALLLGFNPLLAFADRRFRRCSLCPCQVRSDHRDGGAGAAGASQWLGRGVHRVRRAPGCGTRRRFGEHGCRRSLEQPFATMLARQVCRACSPRSCCCCWCTGAAGLLNVGIPHSGARYPASIINPMLLMRDFWRANRTLWRDPDGGLSLAVTTISWGLGATLQFVALKWAADVLQLPLDQSAYLQAAVAIGVVVGASLAGRWVASARRRVGCYPPGAVRA